MLKRSQNLSIYLDKFFLQLIYMKTLFFLIFSFSCLICEAQNILWADQGVGPYNYSYPIPVGDYHFGYQFHCDWYCGIKTRTSTVSHTAIFFDKLSLFDHCLTIDIPIFDKTGNSSHGPYTGLLFWSFKRTRISCFDFRIKRPTSFRS